MYEKENDALNLMVNVPEIDGNVNMISGISYSHSYTSQLQQFKGFNGLRAQLEARTHFAAALADFQRLKISMSG